MVEAVRDLWMPSGSTSLLQHGNLKPVAQDCVQIPFEYLQVSAASLGPKLNV